MKIVTVSELSVGDIVKLYFMSGPERPWSTCIVQQVTDEFVSFFRPYGTMAGFVMSGNRVICYTGIENYKVERNSHVRYVLLDHRDLA